MFIVGSSDANGPLLDVLHCILQQVDHDLTQAILIADKSFGQFIVRQHLQDLVVQLHTFVVERLIDHCKTKFDLSKFVCCFELRHNVLQELVWRKAGSICLKRAIINALEIIKVCDA